ncbi:hypothetical protein PQR67_37845 [Paraburkholderia fungorum]|uniref:hypothetical protein n=1 Tax=Paraburkholderia fungorum TaxID=134537 RepID=UPI0038BDFC85
MITKRAPQLQPLTDRPAWKTPADHHRKVRSQHPRQLFAGDPLRGERLSVEAASLYLEYSNHRVTDETITLLVQLAGECSLAERIDAMFSGATINVTEPS